MWISTIVVPVTLAAFAIATYNRLVSGRNIMTEAWSGIDVLLKMRHDLVPNLVTTVRAYASHEKATFEETIQARDATLPAREAREAAEAESHLNAKLVRVLALAEDYPDLKADSMFRQLMSDLVKVEDDLQYARRYFNGTVRDFNNLVERFPSNVIAGLFHFKRAEFFELERISERSLPKVSLES